ncbi:MAG: PIN domain-containing protein [Spirochaetes bacterium]|nr:PIN domain-containing protein [Spirochaetota bacterium]
MFLIDTSAWIISFSKKADFRVSEKFDADDIYIALPIYQEVLQGFRNDMDFFVARTAFDNAQFVENPMKQIVFAESVDLYRFLRKKGVTIRSGIDVLIAVCALRNKMTVVHRDRDYTAIAKFTDLAQRSV